MSSNSIEEAKKQFLETGRLNRKIVRDEIAMSWYRCKLNNLSSEKISINSIENHSGKSVDDITKLQDLLKKLNKESYNAFIISRNGDVLDKIIYDEIFESILNFREEFLGTTAASLTIKSEKYEYTIEHEHYNNCFEKYCSYAYPIVKNETNIGYYVVFTEFKFNEYMHQSIRNSIDSLEINIKHEVSEAVNSQKSYPLDHFILLTPEKKDLLIQNIKKLNILSLPIFIWGPKGSGKSNLAWFISNKNFKMIQFIDLEKMPVILRKDMIINALCHYETVILDNIQSLDADTISLLTVYTEEKVINKSESKYCNFNCKNIILLSVYSPRDLQENRSVSERFINRMCQQVIRTEEYGDLTVSEEILQQMLDRYNCEFSLDFKKTLLKITQGKKLDEIAKIIENSVSKASKGRLLMPEDIEVKNEDQYVTLAELEKNYTIKVYSAMNKNMTLTSEILGIGRSTLYRKLKSYQIETDE